MKKERKSIQLSELQTNSGQLSWLPRNPRSWTATDINRTVKSINEDPDFLEDRPLLAVENKGKYVVFGGNLRLTAIRKTNLTQVSVMVYFPDTAQEQEVVKRRAIKDNGSFGDWDYDTLANEWEGEFSDWGVGVPDDWGKSQDPTPFPGPGPSGSQYAQSSIIPGAENLPPELQGVDITPDSLPKIQGSDEVALDRVIIVFPKERAADIAQLFGFESIDKVVYKVEEIPILK